MSSPGFRLRGVRKTLKMNQKEFADSLGMGHSNVSRIERDEYPLGRAYLELLREKYNINPNWIMQGQEPVFISRETDPDLIKHQRIPILKSIPAGPCEKWLGIYESTFAESFVEYPGVIGTHLFAIKAKDDSMKPHINDGDILIIDPYRVYKKGIVVVRHEWGYKIRTVRKLDNMYMLSPCNPDYDLEVIVPNNETALYTPIKIVSLREI